MKTSGSWFMMLGMVVTVCGCTALQQPRVKIPEQVSPLTAAQLQNKVPNFYSFRDEAEPQPGSRLWIRINDKTWVERYPNGMESKFKVLGHTTVNDVEGTIVVKIAGDEKGSGTDNVGGLQAFIPDRGSLVMHHFYRNTQRGDKKWNDLGPMLNVQ